uniref:EGF-like domain-containing protein n=1 Tax=Heterorhabditis bacteriophora TaxID=37862 RepID=A0A1I7XIX5_HETBA
MRLLILTGFFYLTLCQSDDDSSLYFSDLQNGRAVWIVEESSLPWPLRFDDHAAIIGYGVISLVSQKTVLMMVVDSSTGKMLGECSTMKSDSNKTQTKTYYSGFDIFLVCLFEEGTEDIIPEKYWNRFHWVLSTDSMQCTISPLNSSRIIFPLSTNPRTFSVRIQAAHGPACLRDMLIQNERPLGCPPYLSHNSFSSTRLNCSCPFQAESIEGQGDSSEPQFPLFELTGTQITPTHNTPVWTVSPCANYHCQNNGTCVVTQEGTLSSICDPDCSNGHCVVVNGTAGCECTQGFIGPNCNVIDVCLGLVGIFNLLFHFCFIISCFFFRDAACAVFGEQAKCIPDAASYALITSTLVNATYDCHCPHPIHGQYVDCMELHFATSTSPILQNKFSPTSSIIDVNTISNIPSSTLITKKPVAVEDFQHTSDVISVENQEVPLRPTSIFVHPPSQVTFAPVLLELATTTEKSVIHHLSSPSTFIFPEKILTTQITGINHQTQSNIEEKNEITTGVFTTSVIANVSESSSFPTPSPMDFSKKKPFNSGLSVQPVNFELSSQFISTKEPSVTEITRSSLVQEIKEITEASDFDSTSVTVSQLTSDDLEGNWQLTTNVEKPPMIWQTQDREVMYFLNPVILNVTGLRI